LFTPKDTARRELDVRGIIPHAISYLVWSALLVLGSLRVCISTCVSIHEISQQNSVYIKFT